MSDHNFLAFCSKEPFTGSFGKYETEKNTYLWFFRVQALVSFRFYVAGVSYDIRNIYDIFMLVIASIW
jgi:hypothetical protein